MEREYLPGEVRDRIKDLMKERKVNQSELARMAGCNKSTISRFLSGQTDTVSDDTIIAIANGFNVAADFLLGISDKPDRTTFDLAELGLTIESGKALYTSETNAIAVNALLGCKSFPALAQLLRQYMEGTTAEGYAAQNQLYSDLAAMIAGENTEAANAIKALKAPPYQADITHIRNVFDRILVELRQNNKEKFDASKALTSEVMAKVIANLPKNTNIRNITPEQMAGAVASTVAAEGVLTKEQLDGFKNSIIPLFQRAAEGMRDGPDE